MAKKTEKPVEDQVFTPVTDEHPDAKIDALRNALARFVNHPGWHTNIYGAQELTIALPADELEAFRRLANG